MHQFRKDPITNQWVIIAPERAQRLTEKQKNNSYNSCPFCPGHEEATPPPLYLIPADNQLDSWSVRVVPNLFPALTKGEYVPSEDIGFCQAAAGIGHHEVIIESPQHYTTLGLLSNSQALKVIKTYLRRYQYLSSDPQIAYIQIFRNHRTEGGASVEHPHSQIIAIPLLPATVMNEIAALQQNPKVCLYCQLIDHELMENVRVVEQNSHFISFVPFAPKTPFETWILPLNHQKSFRQVEESQLLSLAMIVRNTLKRLYKGLGDPPYNLLLHTLPNSTPHLPYHWHLEILPKLTATAGFELGTGLFINEASPEENAVFLRNLQI